MWLLAKLRPYIRSSEPSFNLAGHIEQAFVESALIALDVLSVRKSVERASLLLLPLTANLASVTPHVDHFRLNLVVEIRSFQVKHARALRIGGLVSSLLLQQALRRCIIIIQLQVELTT